MSSNFFPDLYRIHEIITGSNEKLPFIVFDTWIN